MTETLKRQLPSLLIALLVFGPAPAEAFSGTEAASFLEIPVGGRPAALGGAYGAISADAYAPVYNPAGLGFVDTTQVSVMHTPYLEAMNYEFASFVHPFSIGNAFGLSAQYFNTGKTLGRNNAGEETGDFRGHYGAYGGSYGHHLGDHFALGLGVKFIQAKIADVSANAVAADAGAYWVPSSRFAVSAVVTNAGTPLKFITQKDPLPTAYRLGMGLALTRRLLLTGEGIYRRNEQTSGHAGVEWAPLDLISLRAGYRTDTTKELGAMAGFSTGIGIHVFGQEFDYAWLPVGDLGTTHYFSLVLRLSRADRGKRNLIHYRARRHAPDERDRAYYEPPLPELGPVSPREARTEPVPLGESTR